MSRAVFLASVLFLSFSISGQSAPEKIYQTEKDFERAVAEKGFNAGFIEFLSPYGIMFFPEPANAHEVLRARPASPAALAWEPFWIDVSSNGSLAYSIGSSVLRRNGKDDPQLVYGTYLSVWMLQPDGSYKAALDAGVHHQKPAAAPAKWRTPPDTGGDQNEGRLSAADSSLGFYETAMQAGSVRAYKSYLADDAILIRSGREPLIGKSAAMDYLEDEKPRVRFAKRKVFSEANDLAYVYNTYQLVDRKGAETERGNFVQVWKLRKGKWQIAADLWSATAKPAE